MIGGWCSLAEPPSTGRYHVIQCSTRRTQAVDRRTYVSSAILRIVGLKSGKVEAIFCEVIAQRTDDLGEILADQIDARISCEHCSQYLPRYAR